MHGLEEIKRMNEDDIKPEDRGRAYWYQMFAEIIPIVGAETVDILVEEIVKNGGLD